MTATLRCDLIFGIMHQFAKIKLRCRSNFRSSGNKRSFSSVLAAGEEREG